VVRLNTPLLQARRGVFALLGRLALASVWVIAGCAKKEAPAPSSSSAPELSQVTLRVGDQIGLTKSGFELAGQSDVPYRIEWASFSAGPPLLEAINADAVDIGGCGDTPPLFAAAAGANLRIVAAIRNRPEFSAIIAPAGSTLASVRDLRNKRVALAKGSASHYLLLAALEREGMAWSDIQPVFLNPPEAQPAFTKGDVDAWAVWDPFVANNLRQGAVELTTGVGLTDALAFQVTTEKALGDPAKVSAIADYLRRSEKAYLWAAAHKADWAKKYAEITKLPLDVVERMLSHYDPKYVPIDDAIRAAEQRVADAFFRASVLPVKVDVATLLDDRFNSRFASVRPSGLMAQ
jgi:sulfonate transport system substrate-binding protein